LLLLPGLIWSYIFFRKRELKYIERIGISIGLSIAIICLSLFFMNKFLGFKINLVNCTILIFVITFIPIIILILRVKFKKIREFPNRRDDKKV